MKVTITQPTVPSYRMGFFSRLQQAFGDSFKVYASRRDLGVLTDADNMPAWHVPVGTFRSIFPGLEWQTGLLSIPIERGDIVVICGQPRNIANIALLIKARLKGAKTVWWGHFWSSTSKKRLAKIKYQSMQFYDYLLFYTEQEIDEYLASGAAKHDRSHIFGLNNAIGDNDIATIRSPYEASNRQKRLLFIGRLTEKADLDILLQALSKPECYDYILDIIGGGEQEQKLHTLACELNLEERINWHGGTTDEKQIALIANHCSLFVYPGAVGLSLIHAFNYGLPAIVHDDRWKHMPEIAALEEGRNGCVFKKGNPDSLAEMLAKTMSDKERLNDMSQAAIETITISFNVDDMAHRFYAAIEAIDNEEYKRTGGN